MFKILTLFFISTNFFSLCAEEQLVVVISADMNSSTAVMQRYDKTDRWQKTGEAVPVMLGRNGLGWAEGREPLKVEGDGRSPAGVFEISRTFGSDEHPNSAMTYVHADANLICIDDGSDEKYNQMAVLDPVHPPKSFETMLRDDGVYRNGAIIEYNAKGEKGRGSCIFIHLNHSDNRPTSGCTAMDEEPLKELLGWFDPSKKPKIVQIPKSECGRYQKEFAGIECP